MKEKKHEKKGCIGINVGSKLDNIDRLHHTLKMILENKGSDEATKQKALDVLIHICSINNVSISSNSVQMGKSE